MLRAVLLLFVLFVGSATNLATREQQGLRRAEEVLRSINADVAPEVQALYDALARTYVQMFQLLASVMLEQKAADAFLLALGRLPCRWEGTSIIVLDQVKIDAPYTE